MSKNMIFYAGERQRLTNLTRVMNCFNMKQSKNGGEE